MFEFPSKADLSPILSHSKSTIVSSEGDSLFSASQEKGQADVTDSEIHCMAFKSTKM